MCRITIEESMDIRIINIGADKQEYIEIGCHKTDEHINEIVSFLKSRQCAVEGTKDDRQYQLPVVDVFYIESVDDRIFAYTKTEVIKLDGTLAGIIEDIKDERFFRCSKSMIINIDKVERLKSLSSNRIDATMEGGEHILISRTYASEFRRILKGG